MPSRFRQRIISYIFFCTFSSEDGNEGNVFYSILRVFRGSCVIFYVTNANEHEFYHLKACSFSHSYGSRARMLKSPMQYAHSVAYDISRPIPFPHPSPASFFPSHIRKVLCSVYSIGAAVHNTHLARMFAIATGPAEVKQKPKKNYLFFRWSLAQAASEASLTTSTFNWIIQRMRCACYLLAAQCALWVKSSNAKPRKKKTKQKNRMYCRKVANGAACQISQCETKFHICIGSVVSDCARREHRRRHWKTKRVD